MTDDDFAIPTLEGAFFREIPLGRLGTVDNIAVFALRLLSDEWASTTGQAIDCSSGQCYAERRPTKNSCAEVAKAGAHGSHRPLSSLHVANSQAIS